MRCGIYSLAALVSNELWQDPLSGDVFIFIGKRSNQIRLLQWDKDGYANDWNKVRFSGQAELINKSRIRIYCLSYQASN